MIVGIAFAAASMMAAEQTVLHCFTFTPVESAAPADWNAYYKATDALVGKIDGLKRVWYGKLARPLTLPALNIPDADARKKLMDAGKGTAEVTINRRVYGTCMEFSNKAAFDAYGPNAAHKEWDASYSKVRVPGTTTFQLLPTDLE
ncbi:MAG: hypothetical protein WKF37_12055, partial [Bryobacteraceae bacterium]